MSLITFANLKQTNNCVSFGWEKYTRFDLVGLYKNLFALYKVCSFVDLRDFLYENTMLCFYTMKCADKLNVEVRDNVLEGKVINLINEFFDINPIEIISLQKLGHANKYNAEDIEDAFILIQQMKSQEECELPKFEFNSCSLISDYVKEYLSIEEFTGIFNVTFQEEMEIMAFDFYNRNLDDFLSATKELQYISDYDAEMQMIYGDKLGTRLAEISQYAINNNNLLNLDEINQYFSSNKIEPFFYIISSILRYISVLYLTQSDKVFDSYILNYFDSYSEFIYQRGHFLTHSIILEYLNIKVRRGGISFILSDKVKFRPKEVQEKLKDWIAMEMTSIGQYLAEPLIQSYFIERPKVFTKILKQKPSLVDFVDQHLEKIQEKEKNLHIIKNALEEMKNELEWEIHLDWENLNKHITESILILNKLKQENKNLILDNSDSDLLANLFYVYNYINENGINNKTSKAFMNLLFKSNAYCIWPLDRYKDVDPAEIEYILERQKDDVAESFEKITLLNKIIKIKGKIKERLFNLEYSDYIEKLKKETDAKIKEFKSKVYNNLSYDFDKNYQIAYERIEATTKKIKFDFEDIKKEFAKKYNDIISKYQTQEIKDNLATAEYLCSLLEKQNIELTPIFVCFLKTIEQFLCAYVNYLVANYKVKKQYIKISKSNKNTHVFDVNWNKEKVSAIDLQNFIEENYFDINSSLDSDLIESFSKKMDEWRKKARNGNLHKDNVYDRIKMKEYIECCYTIISVLVLLVL